MEQLLTLRTANARAARWRGEALEKLATRSGSYSLDVTLETELATELPRRPGLLFLPRRCACFKEGFPRAWVWQGLGEAAASLLGAGDAPSTWGCWF